MLHHSIDLPAGEYKVIIPGRYLKADNAADVAEVYDITIAADKPVTKVAIPVEKPAPDPETIPMPEDKTLPAPDSKKDAPAPAPDRPASKPASPPPDESK